MSTIKRSLRRAPVSKASKVRSSAAADHVTIVAGHVVADEGGRVSFTNLKRTSLTRIANLKPKGVYLKIESAIAKRLLAAQGFRLDILDDSPSTGGHEGERDTEKQLSPALEAALGRAYERGEQAAAAILNQPDMLSSDEIARRVHVTRETVNQWRRTGKLLGLEGDARGVRYPEWQIVEGRLMRSLRDLFGYFGQDPWALYRFLIHRHDALDGETGAEALRAGRQQEVLALAESVNRGAFA